MSYRVYVAANELPNRTKIGMAQITTEDNNDPGCFNHRCRALNQAGVSLRFLRSYHFNNLVNCTKVEMADLERKLREVLRNKGYKSLVETTQSIGHSEWFSIDPDQALDILDQHITWMNKWNKTAFELVINSDVHWRSSTAPKK